MTEERDYLTLDEVEAYTGIKKGSLYYYLRALKIKTHKFPLDKHAYISLADAKRIKEIKDTPWIAGEKPSQKAEKPSVSAKPIDDTAKVSEKPQERPVDAIPAHLPLGTVSSGLFAKQHGIEYDHMKNYMRRGVNGEKLEVTEVSHSTRAGYTLKFLTPAQQEKAIEILRRHGKLKGE